MIAFLHAQGYETSRVEDLYDDGTGPDTVLVKDLRPAT